MLIFKILHKITRKRKLRIVHQLRRSQDTVFIRKRVNYRTVSKLKNVQL